MATRSASGAAARAGQPRGAVPTAHGELAGRRSLLVRTLTSTHVRAPEATILRDGTALRANLSLSDDRHARLRYATAQVHRPVEKYCATARHTCGHRA